MAYTKQNYQDGQVLTAAKLNAMDTQIAENEKKRVVSGTISGTTLTLTLSDGTTVAINGLPSGGVTLDDVMTSLMTKIGHETWSLLSPDGETITKEIVTWVAQ